jgi:heptose I phosphotransferase
MWIELDTEISCFFPKESAFDQLMAYKGKEYRHVKSRRTVKFQLEDKCYFIKIHEACGWREVWKNWLNGKRPVTSARMEWEAIDRLRELNVPTLKVVGRGIRGKAPAKLESFVITEALHGMVSLEQLTQNWGHLPLGQRIRLKWELLRQLAVIARTIHRNGLNHRDFYLCHFLVRDLDWTCWRPTDPLTLHLIDLHRMQIRQTVPQRWLLKDLAGLLFSAMDCGLTRNDLLRFAVIYWDRPASDLLRENQGAIQKVLRRARRLYTSFHGKAAPKLFTHLSRR